jgi:medium-chain acyl-[acyl-carrier-protein] hydrolase
VGIAVYPLQLPGRESRFQEALFLDLRELIAELTADIGPFLDVPFALFGHSMGAIIAYEWARSMAKPEAAHLFVSGRRAPHLPNRGRPLYDLSDESLIDELRRMEGIPETILNNVEWRRTALPILRADFTMMDTYVWSAAAPLMIPISALGGTEDPYVSIDEVHGWSRHTQRFRMHLLPGGHFFLRDASAAVLDIVGRELTGRT